MKNPDQEPVLSYTITRPIVLVGLMGAGKSSVGRQLAERLSIPFRDADQEIIEAADCSIPDIFEIYGETAFRDVEQKIIQRLIGEGPQVLATGGGAFMNPKTHHLIIDQAISVWLRADIEVLLERTGRNNNRPLLNNGNARSTLMRLQEERDPTYATADLTIDTSEENIDMTVFKVMSALNEYQKHKTRKNKT